MPTGILGREGYVYDAAARVMLGTLASWVLINDSGDAPVVVRVIGGPDWLSAPPADGARLYIALLHDEQWFAGYGVVCPNVAPWTWESEHPLSGDCNALDEWPSPPAALVELGDGAQWLVRHYPRHALLSSTVDNAASNGSFDLLGLFAAYDGGFVGLPESGDLPTGARRALLAYLTAQMSAGLERVA